MRLCLALRFGLGNRGLVRARGLPARPRLRLAALEVFAQRRAQALGAVITRTGGAFLHDARLRQDALRANGAAAAGRAGAGLPPPPAAWREANASSATRAAIAEPAPRLRLVASAITRRPVLAPEARMASL